MGRGQYRRGNAKISTANLLCVRLADFKKQKCFTPGHWYNWYWSRDGGKVAEIGFTITDSFIWFRYAIKDGEDNQFTVDKTIPLTLTPCNFGGYRKWFLCGCGRKVSTMFIRGREIACRNCFNAVYPSQREDAILRKWRKIHKLEAKLKDGRYKPKGMHWRIFARIKNECMSAIIKKDELFEVEFTRRFPSMEL
jgi:hypothetical protein